jgi:hypothetical protein
MSDVKPDVKELREYMVAVDVPSKRVAEEEAAAESPKRRSTRRAATRIPSGSYGPPKSGFASEDEAQSEKPSPSPRSNNSRRGSGSRAAVLDKIKDIVELLDEYVEEKAIPKSAYKALRPLVESFGSLV